MARHSGDTAWHAVSDGIFEDFKAMDLNSNGTISPGELTYVLGQMDPDMWTEERIEALMEQLDLNEDGNVSFRELVTWFTAEEGAQCQTRETVKRAAAKRQALNRGQEEIRMQNAARAQRQMELMGDRESAQLRREARDAEQNRRLAEQAQGRAAAREEVADLLEPPPAPVVVPAAAPPPPGGLISEASFVARLAGVGVQRAVAKGLFQAADADNDGWLSREEYAAFRQTILPDAKKLRRMYVDGMSSSSRPGMEHGATDSMEAVLRIFRCWDGNGDGVISRDELFRVLSEIMTDVEDDEVNRLLSSIDTNNDGDIDVYEFISWLSGNTESPAQRAERITKIMVSIQQKRAEEYREQGRQSEFEEMMHTELQAYLSGRNIRPSCNTLNNGPGAPGCCRRCRSYHFWFCHYCGFVGYEDECVNGCNWGIFGWSCIRPVCPGKKKCGCRFGEKYWRKKGFALDVGKMGLDIEMISRASWDVEDAVLAAAPPVADEPPTAANI